MDLFLPTEFSVLRQNAGFSIREAADFLEVPVNTAYRYESGETSPRVAEVQALKGACAATGGLPRRGKIDKFTFIDLFAGIGGLRRGFEEIGGRCVFTSEWDRHSQQTYRANFGCEHEIAGDIREVREADIPQHDVLLAGFPCQPFSIAGVSKKNALNRPHDFA